MYTGGQKKLDKYLTLYIFKYPQNSKSVYLSLSSLLSYLVYLSLLYFFLYKIVRTDGNFQTFARHGTA